MLHSPHLPPPHPAPRRRRRAGAAAARTLRPRGAAFVGGARPRADGLPVRHPRPAPPAVRAGAGWPRLRAHAVPRTAGPASGRLHDRQRAESPGGGRRAQQRDELPHRRPAPRGGQLSELDQPRSVRPGEAPAGHPLPAPHAGRGRAEPLLDPGRRADSGPEPPEPAVRGAVPRRLGAADPGADRRPRRRPQRAGRRRRPRQTPARPQPRRRSADAGPILHQRAGARTPDAGVPGVGGRSRSRRSTTPRRGTWRTGRTSSPSRA